jgi:hypothetical protein
MLSKSYGIWVLGVQDEKSVMDVSGQDYKVDRREFSLFVANIG